METFGDQNNKSAAEKAKERMERLHKLHLLRATGKMRLLYVTLYIRTTVF